MTAWSCCLARPGLRPEAVHFPADSAIIDTAHPTTTAATPREAAVTTDTEQKIRIWIAAYTTPNAELDVREGVQALGYPVLVPTGMIEAKHARQTMLVERPVFPRYAFIGVPEERSWYPLKTIRGVAGILCANGKPRPIPDKLVRLLRAAVDADAFTQSRDAAFRSGQAVQVKVGQTTLAAFVERVNNMLPAQRIDIVFKVWGKEHRSTVPIDQVRAA